MLCPAVGGVYRSDQLEKQPIPTARAEPWALFTLSLPALPRHPPQRLRDGSAAPSWGWGLGVGGEEDSKSAAGCLEV